MNYFYKKLAFAFALTSSCLFASHQADCNLEPGIYKSPHKNSTIIIHNNHALSGTWIDKTTESLITFQGTPLSAENEYTITNECPSNTCGESIKPTTILKLLKTSSGFTLVPKEGDWSQNYTHVKKCSNCLKRSKS